MYRHDAACKRRHTGLNPGFGPVHNLLLSGVRHRRQSAHQQVFREGCGRNPGHRPGLCEQRNAAPLPCRPGPRFLSRSGSPGRVPLPSHLQPSLRRGRLHIRQLVLGPVCAAGDCGSRALPKRREGTQHGSRHWEPAHAWLGVHAGIQPRLRHRRCDVFQHLRGGEGRRRQSGQARVLLRSTEVLRSPLNRSEEPCPENEV